MALVKFISGGKVVKVLKNLNINQIEFSEHPHSNKQSGSSGSLRILAPNIKNVYYSWHGDFLVDWTQ